MRNIVNITRYTIWFFRNGSVYSINPEPNGGNIGVHYTQQRFHGPGNTVFIKTTVGVTEEGLKVLNTIKEKHPATVIVGTEEQARAYPGEIVTPIIWERDVTVYPPDPDASKKPREEIVNTMREDMFRVY